MQTNNYLCYFTLLLGLTILSACKSSNSIDMAPTLNLARTSFGTCDEGPVDQYTLTNSHGMIVQLITYGGIITQLHTPDRQGILADVVLGFDSLAPYLKPHPFFGAIVGRYGNRIGGAQFSLDGERYQLAANNGPNSLHGGVRGFDKYLWQAAEVREDDRVGVRLTRTSPHLEEGFPGNLAVAVSYFLDDQNQLTIEYEATTDRPTICNLTNHSYFNLAGAGNGEITGHVMESSARAYTPVDEHLIPLGNVESVVGTPFDFTTPKTIGSDIDDEHEQTRIGGGYDHNLVLEATGQALQHVATVYEPTSGRQMIVHTTEPGVQFYTGNFLDGRIVGKGQKSYAKRAAFCLETQHYPDSPNQPQFPSTRLNPGETYMTKTIYAFSLRQE